MIPPHSSYSSSRYCPYLHLAFPDSIDKYSPFVKHSPVDSRAMTPRFPHQVRIPQSHLAFFSYSTTSGHSRCFACKVGKVDRVKILMDSQKGVINEVKTSKR